MKYRACRMRRLAGLEQPLLRARQRPTLNRKVECEPTQEDAEIVGDDPEQQADLVGPEPMTREAGPMDGLLSVDDINPFSVIGCLA